MLSLPAERSGRSTWEGPHVTETLEGPDSAERVAARPAVGATAPKKRSGGLNTMLLADLKAMAGGMGIAGAGSMKKADLVSAIKAAQAKPKGQDTPPADQPKADAKPESNAEAKAEVKGKNSDQPTTDDKSPDQGAQKNHGQKNHGQKN